MIWAPRARFILLEHDLSSLSTIHTPQAQFMLLEHNSLSLSTIHVPWAQFKLPKHDSSSSSKIQALWAPSLINDPRSWFTLLELNSCSWSLIYTLWAWFTLTEHNSCSLKYNPITRTIREPYHITWNLVVGLEIYSFRITNYFLMQCSILPIESDHLSHYNMTVTRFLIPLLENKALFALHTIGIM